MNKEQFIANLNDEYWSDVPQELIDHNLPVVQFFLSNYSDSAFMINGKHINSRMITIRYNPQTDFTLVNYAYERIKELYKKGVLT